MKAILGINAYHADSAAALVVDGAVVAAAEEERFKRVKHWSGFPAASIDYCLRAAGIRIDDVECVAVNSDPAAARWRRAVYVLRHPPSLALVGERLRARHARGSIRAELAVAFPGTPYAGRVARVEHHLAHLASAYFASPFDEAVAVSVDGFGDFASTAWGVGRGTELSIDGKVSFPHSLGIFYQAITQYLGFPNYGDEYKVMGLAPYGSDTLVSEVARLIDCRDDGTFRLRLRYFRHHHAPIEVPSDDGSPRFGRLFTTALEELLGPARDPEQAIEQRHRDIARAAQVVFERAYFGLLRAQQRRYALRALVVAGGCAQNSAANGSIGVQTGFDSVYVAAAGYDAGGALGAALLVANRSGKRAGRSVSAFLGPLFDNAAVARILEANREPIEQADCLVHRHADEVELLNRVVTCICDGGVVGWFQGRMEWGPRALGNRSILADPRRPDIKQILNEKIKRRESFRPFAPSVVREEVNEWFEVDADVPFMSRVFPIRPEKRALIPAVTHVDGTGRLQTVTAEENKRYHGLIRSFQERTGVPMLLNTSFNENEPIVCRPEEALACFLRTRMDMLVLEDWVVSRGASRAS